MAIQAFVDNIYLGMDVWLFPVLSLIGKADTVDFNSCLYYLVTFLLSFKNTAIPDHGLTTGEAG